jgi:hypothetical protein
MVEESSEKYRNIFEYGDIPVLQKVQEIPKKYKKSIAEILLSLFVVILLFFKLNGLNTRII